MDPYPSQGHTTLISIITDSVSVNFSSKSVYAIQLLVDMAVYGDYGNVKVRDISERQGVSAKYLEGIVSVLGKAGIVKGERGPQGGYRLGMSSRNITVGMVVRAIEGDFSSSPIGRQGGNWVEICISKGLWDRIDVSVKGIIDSVTIEDLADIARRDGLLDVQTEPEYYI